MMLYRSSHEPGRPSFASSAEVDDFVATLARFEQGEIGPDEWRSYRLVHGVYGQRQEGVQMVRVKIPQGILSVPQLRALGAVAREHSRGFGHITTRQNLQLHFVEPESLEPALRLLAAAGLTTREACGNSVRNITACPYAGVAADEAFDVTPYAEAMTRHLLRHPLGSTLPRKFKIAWEGCREDHAQLAIHDLGWQAVVRHEGGLARRGFRLTVGGGTATLCRSGSELVDFLPAAETPVVAEAVLRGFQRLGDYEHKKRNRMKFLIAALGWERFRDAVHEEWAALRETGGPALAFDAEAPPEGGRPKGERPEPAGAADLSARLAAGVVRGPGVTPTPSSFVPSLNGDLSYWQRTNVRPQRQPGFAIVTITTPLGDLTAAQLEILADLAEAYSDGTVRTTSEQNLVLRWVRQEDVAGLYTRLAASGLGLPDAERLPDVVSCPGAESCRIAVTRSRGLGRLLGDFLRERPELVRLAPDLRLRISGCPNGCGRHHVADIGFQGSVRQVAGRALPQYFVMLGGGIDAAGTHFGRIVAKVPVRRIPQAVERLLALYRDEAAPEERPAVFFRRLEKERAKAALADLESLTAAEAQQEDFVDLGETSAFRVGALEGECSV